MKFTALFAILSALAALSLGCATDPNKQVVAADAAHASDVRESQEDKANLDAQQKKDHAALDNEHEKQDGKMDKQVADEQAKSDATHVAAEANVVEARKSFRAAATARLEQVHAKAMVLEKTNKKATQTSVANLRASHGKAKAALKSLDDVADAGWFNAKNTVEANLVALEKDLAAVEGQQ